MEVVIRPFRDRDLDQVYSIEKRSFKDPWPKTSFLYPELKNFFFIVASQGEHILGYAIAVIKQNYFLAVDEGKKAHLLNLAVAPDLRRRGFGTALLHNLEETLLRIGVKYIELEVRLSNQSAISFYLHHGFKEKRVIPLYYIDEDAVLMIKKLIDLR